MDSESLGKLKIGIIGTGNMGAPILRGMLSAGVFRPSQINIYDADPQKTHTLAEETGVNIASGNAELAEASDIIILAVKPVYFNEVLEAIKPAYKKSKVLASIAVGVSIDSIKLILGKDAQVVRLMPNLPIQVGAGMTMICFDDKTTAQNKKAVKLIFECGGLVQELEERLMSEVTALTGSSPAYVAMLVEAMGDAAVLSGIPRDISYKLAEQAIFGTAKLLLETGMHPAKLKDMVCSPAGTTIEAVAALEKHKFSNAIIQAMNACTARAREIGGK